MIQPSVKIDTAVVAIATTAPAWVVPLATINTVLATISLVLGITLAVARIWLYFKAKRKQ